MQGYQQNHGRSAPRLLQGPQISGSDLLNSNAAVQNSLAGIGSGLDNVRRIGNSDKIEELLRGSNAMNYGKNIGEISALMGDTTQDGLLAGAQGLQSFGGKAKTDLASYGKQLDFLKGLSTAKTGITAKQLQDYRAAYNAKNNPKQVSTVPQYQTSKEMALIEAKNNDVRRAGNAKYNNFIKNGGLSGLGGGTGVGSNINWLDPANDVITNMNKYTDGGGISLLEKAAAQKSAPVVNKNPIVNAAGGSGSGGKNDGKGIVDDAKKFIKQSPGQQHISFNSAGLPLVLGSSVPLARSIVKHLTSKGMPAQLKPADMIKWMKANNIAIDPNSLGGKGMPTQAALEYKQGGAAAEQQKKNSRDQFKKKNITRTVLKSEFDLDKPVTDVDLGKQTPKVSDKPSLLQKIKTGGKDALKNAWKNFDAKSALKSGAKGAGVGIATDFVLRNALNYGMSDEQKKKQAQITGYENPLDAGNEAMDRLIPNPFNLGRWNPYEGARELLGLDLEDMQERDYNPDGSMKNPPKPKVQPVTNAGPSQGISPSAAKFDGKDFSGFEYKNPSLNQYAASKGLTNNIRKNAAKAIVDPRLSPAQQEAAKTTVEKLDRADRSGSARNYIEKNSVDNIAGWTPKEAVSRLIPEGQQESFNDNLTDRSRQIISNIINSDEVKTDGGYAVSIGDKRMMGEDPLYLKGSSRADLLKKFMMIQSDMSQSPSETYRYIKSQPEDMQTPLAALVNRDNLDERLRPFWGTDFMTNDTIPGAGWTPRWVDELNPTHN